MEFKAVITLGSINLLLVCLLCSILFHLVAAFERRDRVLKLFATLIILCATMLLADSALRFLSEGAKAASAGSGNRWLPVSVIAALYYLVQPLFPLAWLFYCAEQFPRAEKLRLPLAAATIPLAVANAMLSVISIQAGLFFTVSPSGVYGRGPWVAGSVALPFVFIALSVVIILANGRSIPRRVSAALLSFSILPVCAALAQTFLPGASIIWQAISVSIVIVYLNVESDLLAVDYLTGLQNRRSLNRLLVRRVRDYDLGHPFGALMIDIDHFKSINDNFGHQEGDQALVEIGRVLRSCFHQALVEIGRVLRSCFHHKDFIARYAGDEFVVVLDAANEADLRAARERLVSQVAALSRSRERDYRLEVSVGGDLFDPQGTGKGDIEEFLDRIDRKMYADKQRKHSG